MTDRAAIVAEAYRCVGTPFVHGGRQPGVGLDCVGLLVVCGLAGGAILHDWHAYSATNPQQGMLTSQLDAQLSQAIVGDAEPGDVLQIRWPRQHATHLAILVSRSHIAHAHPGHGVVLAGTDGPLARRVWTAWRFR